MVGGILMSIKSEKCLATKQKKFDIIQFDIKWGFMGCKAHIL
jgi:hypothetical protein